MPDRIRLLVAVLPAVLVAAAAGPAAAAPSAALGAPSPHASASPVAQDLFTALLTISANDAAIAR
jgi:hypothetical protein